MIRKLYRKVRASRWLQAAFQYLENPDLVPGRNPDHEGYANFLFLASFGDKWCILSFLPEFLERQANARILAEEKDRELLRIFLGPEVVHARVKFLETARLRQLSKLFNPHGVDSLPLKLNSGKLDQTYAVLKAGFPINRIRPLHVVQYPYFTDLFLHHGVSYGTLLRLMLYLPPEVVARGPRYYTSEDYERVRSLFFAQRAGAAARLVVLTNVVNFSHVPLSMEQTTAMAESLIGKGFEVYLNTTLHPNPEPFRDLASRHPEVHTIEIPGHLLALASGMVHAVIGVVGGAMNVAVQFSRCHILSLFTSGKWLSLESELSLCRNGKNKSLWELYNEDWPCVLPGRVIREIHVGDPSSLPEGELPKIVAAFVAETSSSTGNRNRLDTEQAVNPQTIHS